jgi:hypothetical protein
VVEPGVFETNFQSNIATAPGFDEGSPHWGHVQRFRAATRSMVRTSDNDPQEVADLVFEAATTATPKFRYVAGADARAFIPAYKSMEFEAFREVVLTRAGLPDWAVPT